MPEPKSRTASHRGSICAEVATRMKAKAVMTTAVTTIGFLPYLSDKRPPARKPAILPTQKIPKSVPIQKTEIPRSLAKTENRVSITPNPNVYVPPRKYASKSGRENGLRELGLLSSILNVDETC
jgi:hypothetical protein